MASTHQRTKEEWLKVLDGMVEGHLFNRAEKAYDSSFAVIAQYFAIGLLHEEDFIVDIGSGNGRLAIPLTDRNVTYLGLEPKLTCVDFSRRAFEPWSHVISVAMAGASKSASSRCLPHAMQ